VDVLFDLTVAAIVLAAIAVVLAAIAVYFPVRDAIRERFSPYVIDLRQPDQIVSFGSDVNVLATIWNRTKSTELFFFTTSGSLEVIKAVPFEMRWTTSNKKVDYYADVPPGERRYVTVALQPKVAGDFSIVVTGTAIHGQPQYERSLLVRFKAA
jgi:hypothetical protein